MTAHPQMDTPGTQFQYFSNFYLGGMAHTKKKKKKKPLSPEEMKMAQLAMGIACELYFPMKISHLLQLPQIPKKVPHLSGIKSQGSVWRPHQPVPPPFCAGPHFTPRLPGLKMCDLQPVAIKELVPRGSPHSSPAWAT